MDKRVTINHGSGGRLSSGLIRNVFTSRFGIGEPLTDSAVLENCEGRLAFTTDSYVVNPVFFPGGDIGKLAVCGTVNDLAVSGALPMFISASFIIEEGFAIEELEKIAASMAAEAETAGVRIVTGDTKVVEKGCCDKIFITTSGIGFLEKKHSHISKAERVSAGDRIIINGSVGNHALAILGARKELPFTASLVSDCCSLNKLIGLICSSGMGIHFMRDLTRGGLATVLNELSFMTGRKIIIDESAVPVDEEVKGLCEILGFDPFYLANEGKLVIVADEGTADGIVELMRADAAGTRTSVIGCIGELSKGQVIINTPGGGRRVADMQSGIQLPRIC